MPTIDFSRLWSWTSRTVVPPPPPPEEGATSPHNWRAAHPLIRRLFLRGILPEEFIEPDLRELHQITEILDGF